MLDVEVERTLDVTDDRHWRLQELAVLTMLQSLTVDERQPMRRVSRVLGFGPEDYGQ